MLKSYLIIKPKIDTRKQRSQKMTQKTARLKLISDTGPLMAFIGLFVFYLQLPIKKPEFISIPDKFFRIECDPCPAGADELRVVFYPSDSFIRHMAAIFTTKSNCRVIN